MLSGGHVHLREHLSDDFAADARVGAALSLNERRDTVFVEEEVVDAPPRPGVGIASHADFPWYESQRLPRAFLVPSKQRWVIGEQLLQTASASYGCSIISINDSPCLM